MNHLSRSWSQPGSLWGGARSAAANSTIVLLAIVGCRPADEIHSYDVPKETARPATAVARSAEPTDRMLAAILPDGDQAWFFKVVGPLGKVDEYAAQVYKFFSSVRPASGRPHPDWQLPDGWQQQSGSGLRAATVRIPTDGDSLEISVSKLPWGGSEAELLSNVNRWRGQLQLAPISAAGLTACTRDLNVDGTTMTVVQLAGQMQDSGMTPPFAGGTDAARGAPMMPRATGGNADQGGGLPAGHPPIASSAAPRPAPLRFETPDGWQSLPATGMRKAAFRVVDGSASADVTVIDFPASAGPMISDPLANVNRWRAEVGLDPLGEIELPSVLETLDVDGVSASLIEAIPDKSLPKESKGGRATVAAMVTHDNTIWFFKMTGDRDVVVDQRDAFQSFLKSVRFYSGGQATDGD